MRSLRKNLKIIYDRSQPPVIFRTVIPDDKISWSVHWPEYNPTSFTAASVLRNPPWADKRIEDPTARFQWNAVDGGVNRVSYEGLYDLNSDGYPLNPTGRTGIWGRGYLGKWAVNHAVDCLVTRLKRVMDKDDSELSDGSSYQFIAIQRRDTGEWALPGGMIDAGEDVNTALKREFMEEVLDSERMSKESAVQLRNVLTHMFDGKGVEKTIVYQGYVDDPRNTDNSWMETTCVNIKCSQELEEYLRTENLKAGSDAANVSWVDLEPGMKLYASHAQFIDKFIQSLD